MPAEKPDYYAVLGVPRDSTIAEIRAQYRRLIKETHPDLFAGPRARALEAGDAALVRRIDEQIARAEERSRQLNQAYLVLSDPKKRRDYDRGANKPPPPPRPQGPPKIILSTSYLNLGMISAGVSRTVELVIENQGGMPTQISIDWENNPLWGGQLTIITDPINTFPITVRAEIVTAEMPFTDYRGRLAVQVDGRVYPVDVAFSVRRAPVSHGGPVPITGTPPSAAPGRPPQISLSRLRVDFGPVFRGRKLNAQIRVDNLGGMPSVFAIDWELTPPWAQLTVTPDPRYTFPVRIDIAIDTDYLPFARYPLTLLITVDSQVMRLPVVFEVRDPAAPPPSAPPANRPAYRPAPRRPVSTSRGALAPAVVVVLVVLFRLFSVVSEDLASSGGSAQNSGQLPLTGTSQSLEDFFTASAATASPVPTIQQAPAVSPTLTEPPGALPIPPPAGWRQFSPAALFAGSNWERSPDLTSAGDSRLGLTNNVFQWTIASQRSHDWFMIARSPSPTSGGLYLTIRTQDPVRAAGAVEYGLVYNYVDASNFQAFVLSIPSDTSPNSAIYYRVLTRTPAGDAVKDSGRLPVQGIASNRLTVMVDGAALTTFYVNGFQVYRNEQVLTALHGRIGVFASLFTPGRSMSLSFDDLQVYSP